MKLAVVAGGWHWPWHFFREIAAQSGGADLFVVAHRNPELPIVREEKVDELAAASGRLGDLDREMYAECTSVEKLRTLGWKYSEAPNVCGDWCFFNQWLESHDFRDYDVILNCHDDTYVRRRDVFQQLDGNWILMANGRVDADQAPVGYVRGSFEFFKRELLELLGGRIDLGELALTREGRTDTPADRNALQSWNDTGVPLRDFLVAHGLAERITALSPFYRVSKWIIEGERGFIHKQAWAEPWTLKQGLEAFPL